MTSMDDTQNVDWDAVSSAIPFCCGNETIYEPVFKEDT
jgi:hypothetical protein